MACYAIGDIQGCYDELRALLEKIRFNSDRDRLWLVGDLVNRGPKSLQVLRFVRDLGDNAVSVLGNHDLHLLAAAYTGRRSNPTLDPVLQAPDRWALVEWLRYRPLLAWSAEHDALMTHAGLAPQWDTATAQACAEELEQALRGPNYRDFLEHMYGDQPDQWDPALTGIDRLRFTTNAFTRMRYCHPDGRLEMHAKGPPGSQPDDLLPWFELRQQREKEPHLLFGHWSTLGTVDHPRIHALDTGCMWGGALTALELDSLAEDSPRLTQLPCEAKKKPR